MVEVEVQLLFRVGGWPDKMKLILISTLVEVVVEVEVEIGKNLVLLLARRSIIVKNADVILKQKRDLFIPCC